MKRNTPEVSAAAASKKSSKTNSGRPMIASNLAILTAVLCDCDKNETNNSYLSIKIYTYEFVKFNSKFSFKFITS